MEKKTSQFKAEIAEMLGINHATVRSKLSRALAKMKEFLE